MHNDRPQAEERRQQLSSVGDNALIGSSSCGDQRTVYEVQPFKQPKNHSDGMRRWNLLSASSWVPDMTENAAQDLQRSVYYYSTSIKVKRTEPMETFASFAVCSQVGSRNAWA
jgi:hypothetical protein